MARKSKKQVESAEAVNFFVPMVDLMVSVIFVFIIIVMVLLLLIAAESQSSAESESESQSTAQSQQQGTPVKPSIIEEAVLNQTAEEILVDDVVRELLKREGSNSVFDADSKQLEIKIKQPKK